MFILSPTRALEHYIREGVTRRHMLFHYSVLAVWVIVMVLSAYFSPKSMVPYEIEVASVLSLLYIVIPYWINHVRGGGRDFLVRLAVTNTRVLIITWGSLLIVSIVFGIILGLMSEIPFGFDPDWVVFALSNVLACLALALISKAFWVATRTTQR